jgi:hypothetical protein
VHEVRGVVRTARNSLVAVRAGAALALHEALLLKAGQDGQDCGDCEVLALVSCKAIRCGRILSQQITELVGCRSLLARPKEIHDRPFQFAKTCHQSIPYFPHLPGPFPRPAGKCDDPTFHPQSTAFQAAILREVEHGARRVLAAR